MRMNKGRIKKKLEQRKDRELIKKLHLKKQVGKNKK